MTSRKLCPICKKPRDHALKQRSGSAKENPFAPFCSSRCKDRDLARWFGDGYAVPGRPASPEEIAGEIVREEHD
ncbi:DNA gyrase inhibitor YacG [Altererythrobacter lutimaris]|uniref:DNA gyrase inhibitor YacG n=1 Tax=Altererythrobacter lutimaris TaxID=2743979 RepID=A0A850HCC3_9SPHN|nr:DNA gyrase inhibitor YacG [Altererythrobacter lutimaris]NVE94576.1 DNA gyrase inhibitor YacG [Altererythrobacter lutimaris]